ncbi:guanine-N(1)--methyltransferase [Wolfiporia cocos MD-104 SS10]|uniref:tRNA (guanine(37)-N1)-methyltransferase n=1 Tax=Wolfiporia cocos (strain MD-104) TaxID=742152 RepID=A0A2H3IWU9_WOLCO|nr:guanine-N(1)--methyltransferase [Wolfiporia cocos MD-104 SS10]
MVVPDKIKGSMMPLDRNAFRQSVPVLAAKVDPVRAGALLSSQAMRRTLLDLRRVKSVLPTEDGKRLVMLRLTDEVDLSPEARKFLQEQYAELVTHVIELDYDYWTVDDILAAVLPEELVEGAPSGFAAIGHIAHLNLNAEYLPYKYLIGQVILDKNEGRIKTVVNKTDNISNKFRVFKMELLAGEPNYVVEHHESNCKFTFDFSEVYWNSRLHTEHTRLVSLFKPEDLVADVFAGVGPFALPAAKKGCAVFANDLNPKSYQYLSKNVEDNKISDLVRASCEDGRDFIRAVFERALDNPIPPPKTSKAQAKRGRKIDAEAPTTSTPLPRPPPLRRRVTQFSMNLPDTAIEFLDAFRGVLSGARERELSGVYEGALPMVHCYCFTRELEPEAAERDIRQRVEARLGHPLESEVSVHWVRSVAPNKEMYCISFRLPSDVAFERNQ